MISGNYPQKGGGSLKGGGIFPTITNSQKNISKKNSMNLQIWGKKIHDL